MSDIIEHSGTVERTCEGRVFVRITSNSACGSCSAKSACGMAEAQDKIIEVATERAADFAAGDVVMVGVKRNVGMMSVALAYGGALVVLLAVLFGAVAVGFSEGVAALLSIAGVVAYYGVLWLLRRRIEHKIQFTIQKI